MLDFSQFEWLSFDCYGTLIDWESGILAYLQPLLRSKGISVSDAGILALYSELEPKQQAGNYQSYRDVLAGVLHDFARELDFEVNTDEARGFGESVKTWAPFSDTVPALQSLRSRYKLAILSNIDDDLFAGSAHALTVPFDCIVTAEQAKSYKPSHSNFELLLDRISVPRAKLLHVAESLFHDIAPTNALGIRSVWVNRRQGKAAAASKLVKAHPDLEVPSLAALAELAASDLRTQ